MNARLSSSALRLFVATSSCARSSTLASTSAALARRRAPSLTAQRACRTFSTTFPRLAAVASHPPGQSAQLLYAPTPESLRKPEEEEDEDEPDIDLVPPEEAKLELTERAAEQLRSVAQKQNNPDVGLRILVESGGCHGYQYKLELAKERRPDDYHFSHPTIKPSNVLVDAVSMSLLKGSVIDYATELIGSSFRVAENPQAKGSGCGCGVSWELKI